MNTQRVLKATKTDSRWHVKVIYNTIILSTKEFDIEELEDLHDIIEQGPDWNSIDKIEITYNFRDL